MQAINDNTSLHTVYIVDGEGLSKIFTALKQLLASQGDFHSTLIIVSSEKNFIFDKELEIMQKRYPTQLLLCPMRVKVIDTPATLQESLEAIINSNTKDKIIFILSGDEEFIHIVSHQLWFLGISSNQITTYFLK